MIFTTLLKHRFIPILFTLSITLQISSCSTEETSATNDYLTNILNEYSANTADTAGNTAGDNEEYSEIRTEVIPSDVIPTDVISTEVISTEEIPTEVIPTEVIPTEVIPTEVISTDVISSTDTLSNIILSWIAPAEREDNSPLSLSEIAGYRVYYGTVQGDYLNSIHIDDVSVDSHTFEVLSSSTYYIVMTTYDTDGRESLYSPELTIYT